jgi:hypothetical protein
MSEKSAITMQELANESRELQFLDFRRRYGEDCADGAAMPDPKLSGPDAAS